MATRLGFLTLHTRWPWARQLGTGIAPGLDIRFDEADEADWIAVYDDVKSALRTRVPKARRILFVTEPPGIKTYPPRYLAQFGTIVSPVPLAVPGSRIVAMHAALPWFFGVRFEPGGERSLVYDLDGLRGLPPGENRKAAISAVISTKSKLPRHRERLAFVETLSARLGPRLAVYGQGFQPVADKAQAILPFRYHLVLENNAIPHFWTEKLADAYLGWALPVFSGCATIGEDFPASSYEAIDIMRPEAAADAIAALLDADPWEARLDAIGAARRRLIEEHNLFSVLARLVAAGAQGETAAGRPGLVRPARDCTIPGRLRAGLRRVAGR